MRSAIGPPALLGGALLLMASPLSHAQHSVATPALRLERGEPAAARQPARDASNAASAAGLPLRLDRTLADTISAREPLVTMPAPATAGPVSPAPARVGEVYIDAVMDSGPEGGAGYGDAGRDADPGPLGPGRSVTSVEYDFVQRRVGDTTSREQGVGLRWNRETIDWGYLSADFAGRLADDDFRIDGDHGSGRFTLAQEDFVIGDDLLSDTLLGDQTALSNPLISRSFRFNLPSTYLRGGGVRLHDEQQELRVQAGRVGNLVGQRLLTFEADESYLAGVGYQRRLSPLWNGAVQFWSLRDDPNDNDHVSAALALDYRPDAATVYQLHALNSSGGRLGLWLDAERDSGPWQHRYGLFRFEPELRWLDDPISDDRQGLYWRSDFRATRYTVNASFDLAESNIDGDPTRAGAVSASGFLRGTWLVRRDTQLGGSLELRTLRDGRGIDIDQRNRTALTSFVSRQWALGTTRLQGSTAFTRGENTDQDSYELTLNHAWLLSQGASLDTDLRAARERGNDGAVDVFGAGAITRFEIGSGVSLAGDTSIDLVRARESDTRTLRLSAQLGWDFARQWRLDLTQELINSHSSLRGRSDGGTDLQFFARLRWTETTGSEAAVLGQRGATPGSGRIVGVVFFDENRDGRRSPGEATTPNAVVLLDGRRAVVRTDAQGRFEFWPVFTGRHEVSLRVEELPLPWGLEDETPVPVAVQARDTAVVDFPLIRLDQ